MTKKPAVAGAARERCADHDQAAEQAPPPQERQVAEQQRLAPRVDEAGSIRPAAPSPVVLVKSGIPGWLWVVGTVIVLALIGTCAEPQSQAGNRDLDERPPKAGRAEKGS